MNTKSAADVPKIRVPKLWNRYPVFTSMPESLVTTQKKLSFACETTDEPAPIATTTRAFCNSVSKPKFSIMGASMEAVVTRATVDEPWAVFTAAASKNGSQMLIFIFDNASPNVFAIPESLST